MPFAGNIVPHRPVSLSSHFQSHIRINYLLELKKKLFEKFCDFIFIEQKSSAKVYVKQTCDISSQVF